MKPLKINPKFDKSLAALYELSKHAIMTDQDIPKSAKELCKLIDEFRMNYKNHNYVFGVLTDFMKLKFDTHCKIAD